MKLYKYTAVNENSLSSLTHSHLWFADPRSFNDPFDVNIDPCYDNLLQEIKSIEIIIKELDEKIKELDEEIKELEAVNPKINLLNIRLELNKLKEKPTDIKIQKEKLTDIKIQKEKLTDIKIRIIDEQKDQKFYDTIGVLSLSKENSQSKTLMWSHYGDSHRGIALEFDTEIDTNFFKNPIEVEYSEASHVEWGKNLEKIVKERAPHLSDSDVALTFFAIFLVKSTQWKYEQEVRLIKADIKNNKRLFEYRPECLTGIYFGLNTTEEHKKMIQTIIQLKDLTNAVQFYQAEKVPNAFTLNYKKISIED